jgi:calcineurin-like phosphoesterase family protein
MDKCLVDNWNRYIKPEDTVYVLGDLTLSPYSYMLPISSKLNGIKYLIKGNHDSFSNAQYKKLGFTVFDEVKLKLFGQICRLSHYPYKIPWYKKPFVYKSMLRFNDRRPPKVKGEFLLHGHTHTKYKIRNNMVHVGVDAWNLYPVSVPEIESLVNRSKNGKR